MEREKITFCPHCGVQLKLKDKELENDFIQCTECKQLIKKIQLKIGGFTLLFLSRIQKII
jgi:hypothetical protein